ncbi:MULTISPECIES: DUF6458 family protein [Microbacterium]|jgi:hypothetical protein|uniref:DUF6458 domain-containing protein n=1 Tax=Microbacterium galbinum TaxID=2851646 RepID=A0ABY4ILU2_9MICO|nr:DUF6458 family protein [Microbacterium galbinum]MCK2024023.1 hypothetical protein [Microbacterium galbinum]MCK2030732.1 hypothetical protein [Microbacterium galbinum]UPL13574.1 hypothetical protein KV396_03440 [Microbacterium galbinum]
MSIGTGIVLFVIGAILAFALNVQLDWVNLDLVGYILMAAGAITAIIGIIVMVSRRGRTRGTTTVVEDDRI